MMMKKHLLLLCLTMAATSSIAQINPQRGFVITNGNDTIHGTIDYRSDTKNGRECLFKEDGHTSYQSYKPGEIKEYQLKNENICYVTRTFPVGGSEKTVFAEYLVQEGDIIAIDIANHSIELKVSDEELAKRRAAWVCPEPKIKTGYLARYAKLVSSADKGAILE